MLLMRKDKTKVPVVTPSLIGFRLLGGSLPATGRSGPAKSSCDFQRKGVEPNI